MLIKQQKKIIKSLTALDDAGVIICSDIITNRMPVESQLNSGTAAVLNVDQTIPVGKKMLCVYVLSSL